MEMCAIYLLSFSPIKTWLFGWHNCKGKLKFEEGNSYTFFLISDHGNWLSLERGKACLSWACWCALAIVVIYMLIFFPFLHDDVFLLFQPCPNISYFGGLFTIDPKWTLMGPHGSRPFIDRLFILGWAHIMIEEQRHYETEQSIGRDLGYWPKRVYTRVWIQVWEDEVTFMCHHLPAKSPLIST